MANENLYKMERIGYQQKDVPEEYLVRVINRRSPDYTMGTNKTGFVCVTALLQEKIQTRTVAQWAPLTASRAATGLIKEAVTFFSGRSLVNKYTSRRIWSGSSPLGFTLNFKFEAYSDPDREVLKPLVELQRMSLPSSGEKTGGSTISGVIRNSFLRPPGPSPFGGIAANTAHKLGILTGIYVGERIDVRVGKFLKIPNVVISEVIVEYSPKFQRGGALVSAVATIRFETFEIQTKETIDEMYNRNFTLQDTKALMEKDYEVLKTKHVPESPKSTITKDKPKTDYGKMAFPLSF